MDLEPGSPRSMPLHEGRQGMLAGVQGEGGVMHEGHPLLPQGSHSMMHSEAQGMLPQADGPQNMFAPPFMALGSAGFQSQPYPLPQLGNLFPPAQAHPTSGPGAECLLFLLCIWFCPSSALTLKVFALTADSMGQN